MVSGNESRHWHDVESGYFTCKAVKHVCRSYMNDDSKVEMMSNYDNEDLYGELAVTKDASGYYSALLVADDFGCILFEPRA
jgi:hypothetical protein